MSMTHTQFIERLGAPLANKVWSWGGVAKDGTVFLLVWQDRTHPELGPRAIMVLHTAKHAPVGGLGYIEREKHVQMIKAGAPCYLVLCRAKDPLDSPRKVASYNRERLFRAANELITDDDGNLYLKVLGPVPVQDLLQPVTDNWRH